MNGKLNGWASGILAVLLTGLVGWTAYENLQSMMFRNAGERCTSLDCANMNHRIERNHEEIEHLRIEQQRLQLGLDRVEADVLKRGYKVKSYTEDEK